MNKLWDPPTEIQASDFRSAARRRVGGGRTVLGRKVSLRRGKHRHALSPVRRSANAQGRDGRLRRKPEAKQFLRLAKEENQMGVDRTS